jgi:hypothetical protein
MATIPLDTILTAVKDTLGAAAPLAAARDHTEITDARYDTPLLEVWPLSGAGSMQSQTHQLSITGKHSVKEFVIHVDVYGQVRGVHVGEAMGSLVTVIDEIDGILDLQVRPYFGVAPITSFRWSWEHFTFQDADAVLYAGARYRLEIQVGAVGT